MSSRLQDSALPVEDVFWSEHAPLFTTQFPSYYREPQKVWGRFHISGERFRHTSLEIIPLKEKEGKRVYVLMHPYVYEPYLNFTVKLNDNPKHYHDQESPIGQVVHSRQNGFREVAIGSAQAWYYPTDKMVVLWECFFHSQFSTNPLSEDVSMQKLWKGFEQWLIAQFPQAQTIATPFNDPIAESIEEYQSFLKTLGYSPLAKAAYGKKLQNPQP